MKILIINYEYPPVGGGGGVFSKDLARELAGNNEIDVVTSRYTGLPSSELQDNINIFRVPVLLRTSLHYATMISMFSFLITGTLKAFFLCRKKRYDIIHTHFAVPSGPVGALISTLTGIPNVLSVHGSDIYNPTRKISPHKFAFLRYMVRNILNSATRVVAQSSSLKDHAVSIYRPNKEVLVIPLGIPEPMLPTTSKENLGLDNSRKYIISMGRMAKVKGYHVLIGAFKSLIQQGLNLGLVLAGDGTERPSLELLALESGLSERVIFPGWLEDNIKYKYLKAADLYVMSSFHEGFGVILLEAMFCGLPIVSTDNGGQTDILRPGENALLVPPGNENALADAIRSLLSSPEEMERIKKNNLERAKEFSISKVAERYMELFRETIAGCRTARG